MRHADRGPTPVPYSRPFFDRRDFQKVVEPLRSGCLVNGPQVARFERLVAQHAGMREAVAVGSAAAALRLALIAAGIGPGQEVLVPAFGDPATAGAVEHCGAKPVFCDIDPETFGLDPHDAKRRVTPLTTLVVAGRPLGRRADLEALSELCRRRRLPVIEDCGGIGGFGRACSCRLAACAGFGPERSVATGAGGMVVTDHPGLAETLRLLRGDGARAEEEDGGHYSVAAELGRPLMAEPAFPGHYLPMSELEGALGVAQMEKLAEIWAERAQAALRYDDLLAGLTWLRRPLSDADSPPAPGPFICLLAQECTLECAQECTQEKLAADGLPRDAQDSALRDGLLRELHRAGIGCRQPGRALPALSYYRRKYGLEPADYPQAMRAECLALALPLFVGLTAGEQERVARELAAAWERLQGDKGQPDACPEAATGAEAACDSP